MDKPVLAILTDAIRYDNHYPLKYFKRLQPLHFYKTAPYGDLLRGDLKGAVKYENFQDLEAKLLKLKPDIIQGAEPYGSRVQLKLCYLAWKVSRKLKIPLIFPMLENRPVKARFGPILGPIMRWILKIYARRARMIFYLNDGAKRNLLEAGADPRKLKRLLYGVWGIDTSIFKPTEVAFRHAKRKSDSILFVGRLDEAKGIPYLLEAWNSIKGNFPDVEFLFIGRGEQDVKIKGKQIRRIPWLKTQDLSAYFAQALFTVYPSVTLKRWEEQVGMVNLQSLACGTPVITTKSGAIPEYVNDRVGILVPERDSRALAEAMRKLLKNSKLRKKLGQNGCQYILDNFDAQKTVQKTEKILLELLK